MIKNLEELKSFILWAKGQKVKSVELAGIRIELSDHAFIEEYLNDTGTPLSSEPLDTDKSLFDGTAEEAENEDEILYHSSRS